MELKLPVSQPYSNVSGVTPTASNLAVAQIGINTADGKMWTKDPSGNIIPLGGVSIPLVTVTQTSASATLTATSKDVQGLEVGKALYLMAPFDNVANAVLNINGLGSRAIYFKGKAVTAGIIPANTPTLLVYETTSSASGCWRVVSDIYVDESQWAEVADAINGIVGGTVDVTANTASKLGTARTIALSGDVSGGGSFDGSADLTIATTVNQAPKLSTARTISLSGDASGSVTFNGSKDVAISVTNTQADKLKTARTISLTGDVTGSTTFDGSGNVSLSATVSKISDLTTNINSKVAATGDRGSLAGYETSGTATTINATSPDSNETSSNVTIENGTAGTSWTKVVRVTAEVTVTLNSSWAWAGGNVPTITAGGILICCWCGSGGIAQFVSSAS